MKAKGSRVCSGAIVLFVFVCLLLAGQPTQRPVHARLHRRLVGIPGQGLQCHGGQVGVGSSAAQRKAAVRQLAGQNLGYYIVAGVISVSGNGVTL